MSFRKVLSSAGLLLALVATAAHATPVDVVKIMNFSCPVCRASESLDTSIRDAVGATGGHFVPAPVPSDDSTGGARERVYYAARDLQPDAESAVRTSLFKGSQDMQMAFTDVPQAVAWLQDDIGATVSLNWAQLSINADGDPANASLARAARLAVSSGAQAFPTYILLRQGTVVGVLDPDSIPNKSLLNLRDAVVTAIGKAASAPN